MIKNQIIYLNYLNNIKLYTTINYQIKTIILIVIVTVTVIINYDSESYLI
jgi:hypothetical protein